MKTKNNKLDLIISIWAVIANILLFLMIKNEVYNVYLFIIHILPSLYFGEKLSRKFKNTTPIIYVIPFAILGGLSMYIKDLFASNVASLERVMLYGDIWITMGLLIYLIIYIFLKHKMNNIDESV